MTMADTGDERTADERFPSAHDSGRPRSDEGPLDTGRLAFGDDDVRLPWLEADDEDEEDYQGYNTGQLIGLLVLGLLAIAVIGGGIWWAMQHRKNNQLQADGSIIAAPKQPYKERPKDPGGKTFEGTGDTSFAVSEGQTRPAKLSDRPEAKPAADAASKPTGSAGTGGSDVSGVGVQVAAYSTREQAEAGWTRLSGQYEALSGIRHRVVEGQADIGTVYRLQAVPGDAATAHALCSRLKAAGLACQVKN